MSEIPPQLLQREFGKAGVTIWKKANAVDHSPVVPYVAQTTLSAEQVFQVDTIDLTKLKGELTKMVLALAFELRNKQRLAACITVKIRYTDSNTYTLKKKIPHTANDKTLLLHVLQLFEKLYQRRQLIRLVGVKLSNLVQGFYQVDMFEDTQEEVNLLSAMDKIRNHFGDSAVTRGSAFFIKQSHSSPPLLLRAYKETVNICQSLNPLPFPSVAFPSLFYYY